MTAMMKSRVLVREEKGIGGVSMKRLIFCGMAAGILYMLVRLTPLAACAVPLLFGVFIGLVILSGTRHGVSRYAWLWLGWRGQLLLRARNAPQGWAAQVCDALNWEVAALSLDGAMLFPAAPTEMDLHGIEIMTHDDGDGIAVLEADDIRWEEVPDGA